MLPLHFFTGDKVKGKSLISGHHCGMKQLKHLSGRLDGKKMVLEQTTVGGCTTMLVGVGTVYFDKTHDEN